MGYATALTLSSPPHSYNVTVLEKTSGATAVQTYDPTRAFLYNVNPRGLEWIEQHPRVMERLLDKGYSPESGMGTFVNVPAEPDKAIKTTSLRGDMANKTFDQVKRSVWIARHQMVQILKDSCVEQSAKGITSGNDVGYIEICDGKTVTNVQQVEDGTCLLVDCEDGTSFPAQLVVAADGVDSAVRNCLSQPKPSSWLHSKAESFRMKKYVTPSTGLRLKALQLPPDFQIPDENGIGQETTSTNIYFMESVNQGSKDIRLGLLPSKDPTLVRPANVVTRPDHELWSFRDGPSIKSYIQKSFPRFAWDTIIPDDAEWERFAQAKGTSYPAAQYCPGIAVSSPTNPQVGVVLLGDATHAFAPDIGQGINAGLNDVVALDRCLRGQNVVSGESEGAPPKDLATALAIYEQDRAREHKALIRLARFGARKSSDPAIEIIMCCNKHLPHDSFSLSSVSISTSMVA